MTGSHGRLCLPGQRPSTITLQYRDWELDHGDLEPDGRFDDSNSWMSAYLRPAYAR